jgi:hypothetical protein
LEVDRHYYSVPHSLLRQQFDVRLTEKTIELFHRGQRVAYMSARGGRARIPLAAATPFIYRRALHRDWWLTIICRNLLGHINHSWFEPLSYRLQEKKF